MKLDIFTGKRQYGMVLLVLIGVSCFAIKSGKKNYYSEDIPAEKPGFWLDHMDDPDRVILIPEQIKEMNAKIFKKAYIDHPFNEINRKKGSVIRSHLLHHLKWVGRFKKYNRYNQRINGMKFVRTMEQLMDIDRIPENINVRFGLVVHPTYLRIFPTDQMVMQKKNDHPFDILQLSFLDTGEPLALYHISNDRKWGYILSTHNTGWVKLEDIALSFEKKKIRRFIECEPFVMAIDWEVPIYKKRSLDIIFNTVHMGSKLLLLEEKPEYFQVLLPERDFKGNLTFQYGYVKNNDQVSCHYLKMTPRTIARQSFRMLGEPYSWGGKKFNTDCSSFIKVVFRTMGLELPRNSYAQVRSLKNYRVSGKNRKKVMDTLKPFQTLLYASDPGHIMLYIGEYLGQYYVIHNKWSFKAMVNQEEEEIFIKRTIVSDLALGQDSSDGSLFERIRRIGFFQ
ncbi:MAG: SH3 domain-containing protein [Spirochaetes bacterium]|nr:SH3 domain-containing protein [Spirochaetota bacterium]